MHFKQFMLDCVKQTCARIGLTQPNINVELNCNKLSKVKSTKFLGVVLVLHYNIHYLKNYLI